MRPGFTPEKREKRTRERNEQAEQIVHGLLLVPINETLSEAHPQNFGSELNANSLITLNKASPTATIKHQLDALCPMAPGVVLILRMPAITDAPNFMTV